MEQSVFNKYLQQIVLDQLDVHMQNSLDITHFTKINSKWTIDLNAKFKAIKLLEDNIR